MNHRTHRTGRTRDCGSRPRLATRLPPTGDETLGVTSSADHRRNPAARHKPDPGAIAMVWIDVAAVGPRRGPLG